MVENADGKIVGIVDVVNFDPTNCRAEVGLIILTDLSSTKRKGMEQHTELLLRLPDYALWCAPASALCVYGY